MLLATGAAVSLLLSPTTGAGRATGGGEGLADVAAAEEREGAFKRTSRHGKGGARACIRGGGGRREMMCIDGCRGGGCPPSKGVATDMELIPKG